MSILIVTKILIPEFNFSIKEREDRKKTDTGGTSGEGPSEGSKK